MMHSLPFTYLLSCFTCAFVGFTLKDSSKFLLYHFYSTDMQNSQVIQKCKASGRVYCIPQDYFSQLNWGMDQV